MGAIDVETLRLPVRTTVAANIDAFGPVETEPLQIRDYAALGFARRPLEVGVFDSQDVRTSLATREQPVEERGARVADMQLPGRARSEANTHSRSKVKRQGSKVRC